MPAPKPPLEMVTTPSMKARDRTPMTSLNSMKSSRNGVWNRSTLMSASPAERRKSPRRPRKKRKYRAQRKAQGFGQYLVEVPVDEDSKRTVYAVAQALVDDKDNS
jgi:hypothetical protein